MPWVGVWKPTTIAPSRISESSSSPGITGFVRSSTGSWRAERSRIGEPSNDDARDAPDHAPRDGCRPGTCLDGEPDIRRPGGHEVRDTSRPNGLLVRAEWCSPTELVPRARGDARRSPGDAPPALVRPRLP